MACWENEVILYGIRGVRWNCYYNVGGAYTVFVALKMLSSSEYLLPILGLRALT